MASVALGIELKAALLGANTVKGPGDWSVCSTPERETMFAKVVNPREFRSDGMFTRPKEEWEVS